MLEFFDVLGSVCANQLARGLSHSRELGSSLAWSGAKDQNGIFQSVLNPPEGLSVGMGEKERAEVLKL